MLLPSVAQTEKLYFPFYFSTPFFDFQMERHEETILSFSCEKREAFSISGKEGCPFCTFTRREISEYP